MPVLVGEFSVETTDQLTLFHVHLAVTPFKFGLYCLDLLKLF